MESTPVGAEVVERVAARERVDPVDLDVRLYDAIDADALEALTNRTGDGQVRSNVRVEFSYHGYAVTVDGNGRVIVDEQPVHAEADEPSMEGVVDD